MGLFSKKPSDEDLIKNNIAAQQAELEDQSSEKKKDDALGDTKLAVEVTKILAQIEGLNEQRKAVNERFSHISEEIGEMRGMNIETNKAVSRIEAASTKAIDLVESVKPDQLMIEVRKTDSKVEALKASLEGHEMMMGDIMKEMKEMRKRIDFFKGVEQITKMNDEIKKELIDIKKMESIIDRHSNKVESIFIDVEKKYTELDKFEDTTKDLSRNFGKLQNDVDKLRVKLEDTTSKKELVKLITKFNDFEKHTSNLLNLLEDKSKSISDEIDNKLHKVSKRADAKVDAALKKLNVEIEDIPEEKEEPSKVESKEPKKKMFGFLKKKDAKEGEEKTEEKVEEKEEKT